MTTLAPPARSPSVEAAGLARADWRAMLALVAPALAQQSLLFAVQMTDQWLARPFPESQKAALTVANYVYWFLSSYAVVVTAGATAVVGRLVGARDAATAARATGQALLLAAAFGTLASLLSLVALVPFLELLGLEGHQVGVAADYLRPLTSLLPVYMVEVAGIACLVGAGDTRTGLKVLLAVALVNAPVAYVLSRGPLGFLGISYGTAAAHAAGALLIVVTLARGRFGLTLRRVNLRPQWDLLKRLLRVSLPAAADSLSVGTLQFVFLGFVSRLGETAMSAHGIALRWEGLSYLSGAAFATATAAIVARQLGAGRPDLAMRGARTAFLMGAGVMTAMGAFFFAFARPLFLLFTPADTPESAAVVAAGVPVLRLIAFAMPGLAGSVILTQALRAAGDTRVPMVFTWLGFLGVRVPAAYYLTAAPAGPHLGLFGAWLAMFLDIYVRGGLYLWRFWSGRWQRVRV